MLEGDGAVPEIARIGMHRDRPVALLAEQAGEAGNRVRGRQREIRIFDVRKLAHGQSGQDFELGPDRAAAVGGNPEVAVPMSGHQATQMRQRRAVIDAGKAFQIEQRFALQHDDVRPLGGICHRGGQRMVSQHSCRCFSIHGHGRMPHPPRVVEQGHDQAVPRHRDRGRPGFETIEVRGVNRRPWPHVQEQPAIDEQHGDQQGEAPPAAQVLPRTLEQQQQQPGKGDPHRPGQLSRRQIAGKQRATIAEMGQELEVAGQQRRIQQLQLDLVGRVQGEHERHRDRQREQATARHDQQQDRDKGDRNGVQQK